MIQPDGPERSRSTARGAECAPKGVGRASANNVVAPVRAHLPRTDPARPRTWSRAGSPLVEGPGRYPEVGGVVLSLMR